MKFHYKNERFYKIQLEIALKLVSISSRPQWVNPCYSNVNSELVGVTVMLIEQLYCAKKVEDFFH